MDWSHGDGRGWSLVLGSVSELRFGIGLWIRDRSPDRYHRDNNYWFQVSIQDWYLDSSVGDGLSLVSIRDRSLDSSVADGWDWSLVLGSFSGLVPQGRPGFRGRLISGIGIGLLGTTQACTRNHLRVVLASGDRHGIFLIG